jgi:hypothetical protein
MLEHKNEKRIKWMKFNRDIFWKTNDAPVKLTTAGRQRLHWRDYERKRRFHERDLVVG